MAAVYIGLVSQVIQHLPRWLLGVLDDWSHRLARRRWEQRQARLLRRK